MRDGAGVDIDWIHGASEGGSEGERSALLASAITSVTTEGLIPPVAATSGVVNPGASIKMTDRRRESE